MISTVRCLIRQVFRDKRMKKSVLLWDENGRLFQEKQLKEIQSLPKGLFRYSTLNLLHLFSVQM
jgi:hypothetical protein